MQSFQNKKLYRIYYKSLNIPRKDFCQFKQNMPIIILIGEIHTSKIDIHCLKEY